MALCINSFSTPAGGVVAPVMDVGPGASPADYEGREIKGAVVRRRRRDRPALADGRRPARRDRRRLAVDGGLHPARIDRADAAKPRREWDVLQWGSIPYDETRKAFGFKATPKAVAQIRDRLGAGPARVRVESRRRSRRRRSARWWPRSRAR